MVTASGWLCLGLLAALVAVLGLFALGLWRALDREQFAHAHALELWRLADGQCGRMRRSALDREAALADLRGDIAVLEQRLADILEARRSIAARCELRVLR